MDNEIKKQCELLEKQLKDLTNKLTDEEILNSTNEEKKEYLKLLAEIKIKLEILKNYSL